MAYNMPNFPAGYNPMFPNSTTPTQPYYYNPASTQKQEVIHVNGEAGANAFSMGPNCSALLLDDTAPIVWLAVTDGAAYKTLTPYDISPHKTQASQMSSLEERIAKLEAIVNDKSDTAGTKQKSKYPPAANAN